MAIDSSTSAEVQPIVYRYAGRPETIKGAKAVFHLGGTDIIRARVQVLEQGKGETTLHTHVAVDTFWMVLKGRARFYGPGDAIVADLGPQEGIITPRGSKYWFASVDEEPLEILQIAAHDKSLPNKAIFQREIRYDQSEYDRYILNEERGGKAEILVGDLE